MNDTGGGVTAIHDVPGDITRIGFHWMLLFFLSVTRRVALLFCLHTENRGDHGFSLSRIFEFSNFFFTRNVSEVTVFFFVPNFRIVSSHGESRRSRIFLLSRIIELSNIFHTECRGGHGFFVPRLVLGPTDQREVIVEFLSITRSVADGCGACSSCEWEAIRRCL